jgi:hypothetical protein
MLCPTHMRAKVGMVHKRFTSRLAESAEPPEMTTHRQD